MVRDEAGGVSKAHPTHAGRFVLLKEFGIYPESDGEPLISFKQQRGIVNMHLYYLQ